VVMVVMMMMMVVVAVGIKNLKSFDKSVQFMCVIFAV